MKNFLRIKRTSQKTRWSRKSTINFLEKLEMYIYAGIKLDEAMSFCRLGATDKFEKDLIHIKEDIDSGMSLSAGLLNRVVVSSSVVNILHVGEKTGSLRKSIAVARGLLERRDDLFRKIISSMTYPILIGLFAGLLLIALIAGVMPQIIPMLISLHVKLPLLTRIVIACANIVRNEGFELLLVSLFLILIATLFYTKSEKIKYYSHSVICKLPIIGELIRKISLAVFMRSLGSMLTSNIKIHEAYVFAVNGISLVPLRDRLKDAEEKISSGIRMGDIFREMEYFVPRFAIGLVMAGEKSGTLGASMIRVADILDRDIDHVLKRLTTIVEPVLMILLGLSIGAITLSIIMPIYDLSKALQH